MDIWAGVECTAGFEKYEKALRRVEYADLAAVLCPELAELPEALGGCIVLQKSARGLPADYSMEQLKANFMDCTGFEASQNELYLSAGQLAGEGKRVPFGAVLGLAMLAVQLLAQQLRRQFPGRRFEIVLTGQKKWKSATWRFYSLRESEPPWLGKMDGVASGEITAKFRVE